MLGHNRVQELEGRLCENTGGVLDLRSAVVPVDRGVHPVMMRTVREQWRVFVLHGWDGAPGTARLGCSQGTVCFVAMPLRACGDRLCRAKYGLGDLRHGAVLFVEKGALLESRITQKHKAPPLLGDRTVLEYDGMPSLPARTVPNDWRR